MAKEVASLAVRIGADISGLRQGAKQASGILSDIGGRARAGASNLAKYGAAAAAAGVAVATALVNNARQAIDAQAKMAQQLNTTSASLATLQRAGDLSGVSMEKITSGTRALTVRLAQAAQGTGPAAAAMEQLGLSAEQLASVPLDQRISTINQAIRDTIPAAQQAAVSAQFFGEEAGTAFAQLNPEVLAEASKQANLFGTALSDVDAAKVEMANDALSTITMAFDGIVKQFTVQLAPVLKAIGDLFLSTAEGAGGIAPKVSDSFNVMIKATGFVLDALHGLKVVFSGLKVAVAGFVNYTVGLFADMAGSVGGVLDRVAKLAGFDDNIFADFKSGAAALSETIEIGLNNSLDELKKNLEAPMPSAGLKQFVADAQAAGQAAAEAAVKAREGVNVVPMDSGRTDKEIADINKRLEAIRQANMTELELIEAKFIAENEAIREGLATREGFEEEARMLSLGASERYSAAKLAIDQRRADEELRIEQQKEAAKKAILSQAFGGLTALMNSESRKMFEIGKAASISQAVVSTYTGMAKALELGWPLGPIAAGAIALNGFAQVANIRKQTFGGGGASSGASSNTTQVNAANTPVAQQQQETSRNVYVRGVDPGQMFSGQQLIDIINEAQKDGAVIRMAS